MLDRRPALRTLALAALGLLTASTLDARAAAGSGRLTRLVEPFAGTAADAPDFGTGGGAGNGFPGASAPFGMLQWSPDTTPGRVNSPGGYSWVDERIRGFSLTHLSGAGCPVLQDVPILPTTTPVDRLPVVAGTYEVTPAYVPTFTHDHERAAPGSYRVVLDPRTARATRVELAATTRAGVGRITFPRTATASVLVNAGGSSMANGDAAFTIDPARREVYGAVESGAFCFHRDRYVVYVVLAFDRDFDAWGTWHGGTLQPGATTAAEHADAPLHFRPISSITDPPTTSNGAQAGAWVTFDTRRARRVTVRVGLSYVSVENARANLAAEVGGRSLRAVRRATSAAWEDALGRIRVRGGRRADRRTFYTMLYHALLAPTVFSDVTGEWVGMDGTVHGPASHVQYTTFSGWDVYRSQIPLVAMLFPERASDMAESLVENARESGWLPRWSVANGHTDVMVGDPAAAIIAGVHAFGARDFDRPAALAAMLKGATEEGVSPNAEYVERQGLAGYLAHGWVPHDGTEDSGGISTTIFGSTANVWGSAATTLEYATADFAIAAFAAALGDTATCRTFLARAGGWRHLLNPATGHLQPRYADGTFPATYDPASGEGWVEGSGAQYEWMVPHDVAGLVDAFGGPAAAAARLDAFFTELNAGPASAHAYLSNEPSSLTPWVYLWTGRPAAAAGVVRRAILSLFSATPAGYAGNDDLGQMSAWYIFGALGITPGIPGTDVLLLGSPLFPRAELRLASGTLTIVGRGATPARPYVRHVALEGHERPAPWLRFADVRAGGRLVFDLAAEPDPDWGTGASAQPPSYPPDDLTLCDGATSP